MQNNRVYSASPGQSLWSICMKKRVPVFVSGVAWLLVASAAASGREALSSLLDREIPKLVRAAGIPGMSIAVVQDGKLYWSGAFGVRDMATGAPVRKDTVFEAASLS